MFIEIPEELASDPWVKVVEMLQQNWAVIVPRDDAVLVVFYRDTRGVFDQLVFGSAAEAADALARHGFSKYLENLEVQELVALPEGRFHERGHPTGPIY